MLIGVQHVRYDPGRWERSLQGCPRRFNQRHPAVSLLTGVVLQVLSAFEMFSKDVARAILFEILKKSSFLHGNPRLKSWLVKAQVYGRGITAVATCTRELLMLRKLVAA
jgi:hypothetical protein